MLSLSFLVPLRKANAEQLLFTSIITQNFAESRIRAAFFAVKMQDVNVHRGFGTKKVEKYVRLPNRFSANYPAVLRKICVFRKILVRSDVSGSQTAIWRRGNGCANWVQNAIALAEKTVKNGARCRSKPRNAQIRISSGKNHLTNVYPYAIIILPFCYMAKSYNMTTVVKL